MARVAIVTGGTRGIGEAISLALQEMGITVAASYAGNDERAAEFTARTGIKAYKWDVGDFDACQAGCAQVAAELGDVDIVVNNAGIMLPGLLGMISDDVITSSFNLNAISVIHSMQAASRLMMRKKSGTIINISSILGIQGTAGQVVYSATKAAVIGMTKSAAKELAPHGIRVNCVAPGFILTDLTATQPQNTTDSIPLGYAGDPSDVAHAILFFASPHSKYITGQILGVDGGMIV